MYAFYVFLVRRDKYRKDCALKTVKPGCKKAAVSGASLESDPGEKIALLAQCAIEGVVIILFLV